MNPRWIERRQQLHRRFLEVQRLRDASQLAYLRGSSRIFTEEEVAALWSEVNAQPMPGTLEPRNHVYLHVPFCKSICSFCNYERLKPSHPDLMKGWLKRVLRTLEVLGPSTSALTFHSLYIGGGTPSTLPAAMLDEVLSAIHTTLTFDPGAGRHIELDPAVISERRLDVLQRHGFERFSFGIQSLDAANNAAHDRGQQGKKVVDGCFDALAARDWERVSCDFLLGLWGTTPEQILGDITYVMERNRPISIDIFELVPTQSYVQQFFDGDIATFWRHMEPFQTRVPSALPALAKAHGYQLMEDDGHCYRLHRLQGTRSRSSQRYSYTQLASMQQRPLNLLGLGTSARSQIFERAAFQYLDPNNDPGAEGPASYQGHRINPEIERRTYLVHQLRDRGNVERERFAAIFGPTLDEAVGVPLAALKQLGLAEHDGKRLTLRVDNQARAEALLWLVPDAALEYEIGRIQRLDLSERGVEAVFRDLPIGSTVVPGYRWWGVRDGRATLKGDDGHKIRLRLAPPLKEQGKIRLVVETRPPDDAVPVLSKAVAKLRRHASAVLSQGRPG